MGQVDPKSTMLCLTLESLFLPDDLRLGSGSVCLLKPKVGEKVTGVVGSSTALSYPNKHAKPECSAPRLCVWFGCVEGGFQLAFTCGLATLKLFHSLLLHVVWLQPGWFAVSLYMELGCAILRSARLGFYSPCTKTVQVVMLGNNLDKVRSQTQPGTAPCSTIIKILEHCYAPASSTTTKVLLLRLLKPNVFCFRCRGLDINPSLHFRGGIQMASSHVSCSTFVWVECIVNNILHKEWELLNLFLTSSLQPIFLQAVSAAYILKWQTSQKSLFLTHTKHTGKI